MISSNFTKTLVFCLFCCSFIRAQPDCSSFTYSSALSIVNDSCQWTIQSLQNVDVLGTNAIQFVIDEGTIGIYSSPSPDNFITTVVDNGASITYALPGGAEIDFSMYANPFIVFRAENVDLTLTVPELLINLLDADGAVLCQRNTLLNCMDQLGSCDDYYWDASSLNPGNGCCRTYGWSYEEEATPVYTLAITFGDATINSVASGGANVAVAGQSSNSVSFENFSGGPIPSMGIAADICLDYQQPDGDNEVIYEYFNEAGDLICVDVFNAPCPPVPVASCNLTTSDPANQCDPGIAFQNLGPDSINAITFNLLNGVEYFDLEVIGGIIVNPGPSTFTTIPQGQNSFPPSINDLASFQFSNVIISPQLVEVIYYNDNGYNELPCRDTLEFFCPVTNPCLEIIDSTINLDCNTDSTAYDFSFDVVNPLGGFFEDIGYIKVDVTYPDGSTRLLEFFEPDLIGAGEGASLAATLPLALGAFGDSLCVTVSAHNDENLGLCCFVDSFCLEIPQCEDPCDLVEFYLESVEGDSCCFTLVLENNYPVPGFFDAGATFLSPLIVGQPDITINEAYEVTPHPTFEGFFLISLNDGQSGIGIYPLLEFCPSEQFQDTLFVPSQIGNQSLDLFCEEVDTVLCPITFPCDSLTAQLTLQDEDLCCYDFSISNTFSGDPGLIDSLTISLLTGPNPTFAGFSAGFPGTPGWSIQERVSLAEYVAIPDAGFVPVMDSLFLFELCITDDLSADSTYVEVQFFSDSTVACTDTLAAICPGCWAVDADAINCLNGINQYLYSFSFTNYSGQPVNAVTVLANDDGSGDMLMNGQTHTLATTLEPGETSVVNIPVTFQDSNGDGAFCFDLVLRYIEPAQNISIECCFSTHCIEFPPCLDLNFMECQLGPQRFLFPPLLYRPICGCNDTTYANNLYATDLATYREGECNGRVNPPTGISFPIINFPTFSEPDEAYLFNIPSETDYGPWSWLAVQRFIPATGEWLTILTQSVSASPMLLDFPVALGTHTYQVVLVPNSGVPFFSFTETLTGGSGLVGLSAYPNPATDLLSLNTEQRGEAEVTVFAATGIGHLRQRSDFLGEPVTVPISALSPGVYYVRVHFTDGTYGYQRFIKQ